MILSQSSHNRPGHRVATPAISLTALWMPVARRSSIVIVIDRESATKSSWRNTTSSGWRTLGPSRATSMSRSSRIQRAICLSLQRGMSGKGGVRVTGCMMV
ncbi:hypothetical protein M3J09_007553 [Ascochyta lentis]